MAPDIITFSRVSLAALVEVVAVRRHPEFGLNLLPSCLPALVGVVFLANYVFWFAWAAFIYPFCLDPLRNFPAPKVSKVRCVYLQAALLTG